MDRVAHDTNSEPRAAEPSGLPQPLPLVLSILLGVATIFAVAWWLRNGPADHSADPQSGLQPQLFAGWEQPRLALLLSGESYGYLQPCGCSEPQKGGLARRYTLLESLRKKGWPVVALDLGDLPEPGSPQSMLKYVTAMKALKLMDYTAVTFGKREMNMPLFEGLAEFALNEPRPSVVATNLVVRGPGELFQPMVHSWAVGGGGNNAPRVGVIALVAPSLEKEMQATNKNQGVLFESRTDQVLRKTLTDLRARERVDLVVLLYQGTEKEALLCAKFCAQERVSNPQFPRVDIILHANANESEPADKPLHAGNSMIVNVGHKGRNVGVVGVYRSDKAGQPWQLRYQRVEIGPEFETPRGKEKTNPVMVLMEEYAETVKTGNYLAKYPRKKHPTQLDFPKAEYVGATSCKGCHPHAYEVWKNTPHVRAYDTLVKATRPSNRQFDGECISCHVVGFPYESGFKNAQQSKHLFGVSCESCHGPGSEHVDHPKNKKLYPLINPHKAQPNENAAQRQKRMLKIENACIQCHNIDNDVHWNFQKNWPSIAHMTPAKIEKK